MKIAVKYIKGKQALEWISSGKAVLRNDLRHADLEGWVDFYILDSGELLMVDIFEKRNGTLYPNYETYLKLREKVDKQMSTIKENTNQETGAFNEYYQVTAKQFEEMIPKSSQLLEKSFELKSGKLDYSIESLNILNRVIKKFWAENDGFDLIDQFFIPVTAYCGEVMRREIDGEWKITSGANGEIHEIVVIEKGNPEYSYSPKAPLMKIIEGSVGRTNLKLEVKAQLWKYGFIKP